MKKENRMIIITEVNPGGAVNGLSGSVQTGFIGCLGRILLCGLLFSQFSWSQPMDTVLSASHAEPVTVESVNLNKYAGTWYEIAKIPNSFQKQCACNTTAEYSIRADGRIDVINRCTKSDGTVDEAKGIARIADTLTNSKLEVSFVKLFGIQLFWGDYWIIGLDKDYRYAVVGSPSRKYGWILGRLPSLSQEDQKRAFDILKRQGYDPKNFVFTEQKQ
jgi:apolipoprotein D and lipocalin family protein